MQDNYFPLSGGRTLYAYRQVFGIGPDLRVHTGFDVGFDLEQTVIEDEAGHIVFKDSDPIRVSLEDKILVADTMIARWTEFKQVTLHPPEEEEVPSTQDEMNRQDQEQQVDVGQCKKCGETVQPEVEAPDQCPMCGEVVWRP